LESFDTAVATGNSSRLMIAGILMLKSLEEQCQKGFSRSSGDLMHLPTIREMEAFGWFVFIFGGVES
jgi:hypothetical protein